MPANRFKIITKHYILLTGVPVTITTVLYMLQYGVFIGHMHSNDSEMCHIYCIAGTLKKEWIYVPTCSIRNFE